jgi:hypothetical protein
MEATQLRLLRLLKERQNFRRLQTSHRSKYVLRVNWNNSVLFVLQNAAMEEPFSGSLDYSFKSGVSALSLPHVFDPLYEQPQRTIVGTLRDIGDVVDFLFRVENLTFEVYNGTSYIKCNDSIVPGKRNQKVIGNALVGTASSGSRLISLIPTSKKTINVGEYFHYYGKLSSVGRLQFNDGQCYQAKGVSSQPMIVRENLSLHSRRPSVRDCTFINFTIQWRNSNVKLIVIGSERIQITGGSVELGHVLRYRYDWLVGLSQKIEISIVQTRPILPPYAFPGPQSLIIRAFYADSESGILTESSLLVTIKREEEGRVSNTILGKLSILSGCVYALTVEPDTSQPFVNPPSEFYTLNDSLCITIVRMDSEPLVEAVVFDRSDYGTVYDNSGAVIGTTIEFKTSIDIKSSIIPVPGFGRTVFR